MTSIDMSEGAATLTNEWVTTTVGDCLNDGVHRRTATIQKSEYRPFGEFPVLDQGVKSIAGWTDDASLVISDDLPLVLFGDHTRVLKYVDHPFVRGADGTQLLRTKPWIDARFFYFALRFIDLPSRGYNRHFKMLRDEEIRIPRSIEVQRSIAEALNVVERAVTVQKQLSTNAVELKKTVMEQVFRAGLRGEAQTDSELGPVPAAWIVEDLGYSHTVRTGTTPARGNSKYWEEGTIPWVKTGEVSYSTILETSERITPAALEETTVKLFPVGTLLLAMYGQGATRGKVGRLGIEAACNQACAAIGCPSGVVDSDYLYSFLEWQYEAIRGRAHGGQQQNLSLDIVRSIPIAYPKDLNHQKEIAGLLRSIDEKIRLHQTKLDLMRELFLSLLRALMTGEVAWNQLIVHEARYGSVA